MTLDLQYYLLNDQSSLLVQWMLLAPRRCCLESILSYSCLIVGRIGWISTETLLPLGSMFKKVWSSPIPSPSPFTFFYKSLVVYCLHICSFEASCDMCALHTHCDLLIVPKAYETRFPFWLALVVVFLFLLFVVLCDCSTCTGMSNSNKKLLMLCRYNAPVSYYHLLFARFLFIVDFSS